MAITELSGMPGIRVGHRGPTVVSCFLGWPNAASLQAMAKAQEQVAKQYGLVTVLAIIPPLDATVLRQQGNPELQLDDSARGDALRGTTAAGEKAERITLASALVVLPKGLVAVMIRSFIVAMSLVSKAQTPMQTFKELAPAVEWLAGQPRAGITPGLLRDVEEWLQK